MSLLPDLYKLIINPLIADELHFSSSSNFCRYFKKFVGMTPVEYRNI